MGTQNNTSGKLSVPTKQATTTVINVTTHQPYDVYIGRYNSRYGLFRSIWHNPYKVGVDGTREECIEKYRQHITSSPELMALLPTLKGKRLGCWCKPAACHGDVLVELLEGIPS